MALNARQESNGGWSLVGRNGVRAVHFMPQNRGLSYIVGQVARTDTTAKTIGVVPKGGIPVSIMWTGVANSDAATTATLSVGYTTGTEFLNGVNVKTGSTSQNFAASGAALGAALSATVDTPITAVYAETGTASTTGGPWTVVIGYFMPG
jgi:hypothetical protein